MFLLLGFFFLFIFSLPLAPSIFLYPSVTQTLSFSLSHSLSLSLSLSLSFFLFISLSHCLSLHLYLSRFFLPHQLYTASSILSSTVFLYQPGANGNAQQIYELTFILWTLSLGCEEKDLASFLSAGAIRVLFDLICAAPTRKVSCDESKTFINQNQRVILTSL